ncbi:MAG: hypothetical protein ACRC2N_02155 [Aeromonas sp.]
MRIELPKGCPSNVATRALEMIQQVEAGEIRPKRLWCHRQRLAVVEIGYRYRAIKLLSGRWSVVSHECYNKSLHKL